MEYFIERMNIFLFRAQWRSENIRPTIIHSSLFIFSLVLLASDWLSNHSNDSIVCGGFIFAFEYTPQLMNITIKQLKRKWLVFEHLMKGQTDEWWKNLYK